MAVAILLASFSRAISMKKNTKLQVRRAKQHLLAAGSMNCKGETLTAQGAAGWDRRKGELRVAALAAAHDAGRR